jgi:signal transduction histidine kinase/CheY-like chemotaxis protein
MPRSLDAHPWSPQLRWLLVFVGYVVGARLGLLLATHVGAVTPVWPPTGIALAALLTWGWRSWQPVLAAAFAINFANELANRAPLAAAVLAVWISLGNVAGPLVATWVLRRVGFDRDLGRVRDVRWLFIAAAAGAVVSAVNGVSALVSCGALPVALAPKVVLTWWVGDALGFASFAPGLLVRSAQGWRWRDQWRPALVTVAVSVVVGFDLFDLQRIMATQYLTLLPLVWLGISGGPRAVAAGYVLLASVLVVATNLGLGPMNTGHFESPLVALAIFLAVGCFMALMTGVWSWRLRRLLREAEAGVRVRAEFLATMSHELRTPLNGVIGSTSLLDRSALGPDQQAHVDTIVECSQHLLTLIEDVLDFSKLDAGQVRLNPAAVDLGALGRDALVVVTVQAREKGLALRCEVDPVVGWALCDEGRLKQVLVNLLGNAVKFTERGAVTLRLAQVGDEVQATVVDTGIGISSEALGRIFDAFVQADASTSRRHGGTGLGLTISRRLCVVMGGDLRVASTPGQGSSFTATVRGPRCAPVVEALPVVAPARSLRGRVLVAEDNAVNARVVCALLTRLGLEVVVAGDGEQALSRLAAEPFDLLLLDCHMPVLDGFETARRLRASGSRLPVVALTASTQPEDQEACRVAGMDAFLAKPVNLAALQATLARWLPVQLVDEQQVRPLGSPATH